MNTPDEVYERVGDALGYGSGDALSPTERLIADVAYHYPTKGAMITVSGDNETLEIGSTRDELIKYLKECAAEDYARDVLRWYDTDRARPLTLQNGPVAGYDIWKIT